MSEKPIFDQIWRWKTGPMRPENRKGQRCRIVACGKMNSVCVEFESDGSRVITSRYAVRKA